MSTNHPYHLPMGKVIPGSRTRVVSPDENFNLPAPLPKRLSMSLWGAALALTAVLSILVII